MHSVNECIVNDGGTLLVTAAMDRVLGLVGGGQARLVKVEAGCRLATLQRWLADRVGGWFRAAAACCHGDSQRSHAAL
jgi:FAD/FMN-containing dehydrogenase